MKTHCDTKCVINNIYYYYSLRLTFKVEVGSVAQQDLSCVHQAPLGHFKKSIADPFLKHGGRGLPVQQVHQGAADRVLVHQLGASG